MPYMYGPNLSKHTDITEVMKKKKYKLQYYLTNFIPYKIV